MSGLQVSSVALVDASASEARAGLLGWVSCVLGGALVLDGVALRRTADGRFTLSYPARRDQAGRRHPYLRPRDDAARRDIEAQVFSALRLEQGAAP